jgi:hypothetical protein
MFFYCIGGLVWYSLFYRSRYIPRAISAFGVAAVAVGLMGILFEFSGSVTQQLLGLHPVQPGSTITTSIAPTPP